jgi:uncharacterized protein (TIGR03435 family)
MILLLLLLLGQTFEVASVKPSAGGKVIIRNDPGRVSYSNVMLRLIILKAYDMKDYQLSGPDWLTTLRYDITAKVPESSNDIPAMLRDLLTTRFQMKVHRETKEMPIYELTVSKNKLKSTSSGDSEADVVGMKAKEGKDGFPVLALQPGALVIETRNGGGRISGKDVPISKLAELLSGQVGRPVFDRTGLAGNFSFVVYFSPDEIFAALQEQMGLKLQARKGPVEYLVIDQAEKVPTAN